MLCDAHFFARNARRVAWTADWLDGHLTLLANISGLIMHAAALDKMAGPLLDSKSNPIFRKGTAHYKPSIPKALL